jgi:hypothetical protein
MAVMVRIIMFSVIPEAKNCMGEQEYTIKVTQRGVK